MISDPAKKVAYPTALSLAELYAYPPQAAERCWVRANMVSSVDGSSSIDGTSTALGNDGDALVFSALRGICDVVLVSSSTVSAEGYEPVRADPEFASWRRHHDMEPYPRLAIISAALHLDPSADVVRDPRTIIITHRGAPRDARRALSNAGATLADCGDDDVDIMRVLALLAERGLRRVLCEGGPSLLGRLEERELLDELCLTLSPNIIGGDAPRIVRSSAERPARTSLRHLLVDDDYIYTRWSRADTESGP
jgi:riboflavin biosynthesis pyrimidine reductase